MCLTRSSPRAGAFAAQPRGPDQQQQPGQKPVFAG